MTDREHFENWLEEMAKEMMAEYYPSNAKN